MFKLRTLALSCAALVIAGCGGGQEDLHVSVTFPAQPMSLYRVSVIAPQLRGFDGHDQRCDQSSGVLPIGVHINNDCSISGRPTQTGNFNFDFRIRAEDAQGSVYSSASVTVVGPRVAYPFRASTTVGTAVNDAPTFDSDGWIAPTDTALTWSYALTAGSLPPGLTLNATTGVVSGTPTSAGSYNATIRGTLTTAYGSFTPPASTYALVVSL